MLMHRRLWRALVDAIGERIGVGTPNLWLNHYSMLYVNTQAMAVRRVVRDKDDGNSWFSLFDSINRHGSALTVDAIIFNLVGQSPGVPDAILNFERQEIEGSWFEGDRFRTEQVANDREQLRQTARTILDLADKSIAHIDPKAKYDRPTYDDLDQSIEHLTDIQRRYVRLISGVDNDPETIGLEAGWTDVFTRPLFPPL